jgi:hypothetical protein
MRYKTVSIVVCAWAIIGMSLGAADQGSIAYCPLTT